MLPLDEEGCSCDSCGCDDDECGAEVIIMKIEKSGEEEYLVPVEDDDELEKAFEAFQDQIDDEDEDEDL